MLDRKTETRNEHRAQHFFSMQEYSHSHGLYCYLRRVFVFFFVLVFLYTFIHINVYSLFFSLRSFFLYYVPCLFFFFPIFFTFFFFFWICKLLNPTLVHWEPLKACKTVSNAIVFTVKEEKMETEESSNTRSVAWRIKRQSSVKPPIYTIIYVCVCVVYVLFV